MLHPFVSSPAARHDHLAPIFTLSTSAHVGLLFAAVISTGVVRRPQAVPALMVELVRFVEVPFRTAPSSVRTSNRGRGRMITKIAAPVPFQLPQLPASFDLVLPDPPAPPENAYDDAVMQIGSSGMITDDVLGLGIGGGRHRVPGPYGAYDEVAVERPVSALPGNPKPRYPGRMANRSVETNFNVTFVVDTTGTVVRETVELPPSVLQEFASAVREVLFDWRFVPAELGGRRVRQRVLQPFSFRVERGAGGGPY
jgi:TonB family protein